MKRVSLALGLVLGVSGCGGGEFRSDSGAGGTSGNGATAGSSGAAGNGGTAAGNGGEAGNSGSAGNSSGGSAAGGNAGQPAGGAGGTGSGDCPSEPVDGDCASPGLECTYPGDSCCARTRGCVDGIWTELPCTAYCPTEAPGDEQRCDCPTPTTCTYSCNASSLTSRVATCAADTWVVTQQPCPGECQGVTCMPGQVCVRRVKGETLQETGCFDTDCEAELSCGCAAELCDAGNYTCFGTDGLALVCTAN